MATSPFYLQGIGMATYPKSLKGDVDTPPLSLKSKGDGMATSSFHLKGMGMATYPNSLKGDTDEHPSIVSKRKGNGMATSSFLGMGGWAEDGTAVWEAPGIGQSP